APVEQPVRQLRAKPAGRIAVVLGQTSHRYRASRAPRRGTADTSPTSRLRTPGNSRACFQAQLTGFERRHTRWRALEGARQTTSVDAARRRVRLWSCWSESRHAFAR